MSGYPSHPLNTGEPLRLGLFDLDGTLIDSAPDLALAIDAMLQSLDLAPAGEARVRQWIGKGAERLVQTALTHALGAEAIERSTDLQATAMTRFMTFYDAHCTERTRLYPDVRPLLLRWHAAGVVLAIVTNKPLHFTRKILAALQVDALFAHVLGGDGPAGKKPSPRPLLSVCEASGIPVAQALMIGDSANDVGAARAAGISVVCVTYGYNHGQPVAATNPDRLVDSLAELG